MKAGCESEKKGKEENRKNKKTKKTKMIMYKLKTAFLRKKVKGGMIEKADEKQNSHFLKSGKVVLEVTSGGEDKTHEWSRGLQGASQVLGMVLDTQEVRVIS